MPAANKWLGKQEFDYFPTDFKKEKFSLANILKETYKLKDSKIRNFTELIYFLDRKPANIVHGIGCAEDIIPEFFSKKSFNQCRLYLRVMHVSDICNITGTHLLKPYYYGLNRILSR